MLWQGRRESENVEDARGSGGGGRIVLGGGIGTVILVVAYLLLGGDPQALFSHSSKRNYRNLRSSTIKRRAMRHRSSSPLFSLIPKTPGMRSFGKWAGNTKSRGSCSSRT